MTAADTYAELSDAVNAQRSRIYGADPQSDPWTGTMAQLFRFHPNRTLDVNLAVIASYVQPEDVFIDVGGGAGRVSLPLALQCRESIVVDPSSGMGEEFETSKAQAGITNARRIPTGWLDANDIHGDVVFSADVTYFVRDIVPFVHKLEPAAARRVIIALWSVSPPDRNAELFQLIYGEEQAPVPGFRDLIAVLWEMGILPEVRVLPTLPWWEHEVLMTREDALQMALQGRWLRPEDHDRARPILEEQFDILFSSHNTGFYPKWRKPSRELLITWETSHG